MWPTLVITGNLQKRVYSKEHMIFTHSLNIYLVSSLHGPALGEAGIEGIEDPAVNKTVLALRKPGTEELSKFLHK